jgi:hypothetical protein
MTTERCLIRALLIMSAICAVPDRLGVKPFCMLCSTKLLDARKECTAFRRQDVNTFKGMDSSVMGRKFEGSLLLLVLLLLLVFINHLIKIHIKFTYLENCNIEAT